MLCDHLEGWYKEGGREGDAREKRYGDICICIAYSLCYKGETNTPLSSNYTPIKMLKKKKKQYSQLSPFSSRVLRPLGADLEETRLKNKRIVRRKFKKESICLLCVQESKLIYTLTFIFY